VQTQSHLLHAALVDPEGYALEEHTVQTADGYLLGVYRLPRPRVGNVRAPHAHRCAEPHMLRMVSQCQGMPACGTRCCVPA